MHVVVYKCNALILRATPIYTTVKRLNWQQHVNMSLLHVRMVMKCNYSVHTWIICSVIIMFKQVHFVILGIVINCD